MMNIPNPGHQSRHQNQHQRLMQPLNTVNFNRPMRPQLHAPALGMNVNASFKCPSSIHRAQYVTENMTAPTVHTAPRYNAAPSHQSTVNGTIPVSVPIGVSAGAP